VINKIKNKIKNEEIILIKKKLKNEYSKENKIYDKSIVTNAKNDFKMDEYKNLFIDLMNISAEL